MDVRRKRVKPITIIIITMVVLFVIAILYVFTPIGFWGVTLDGEYQMIITVNGEHELMATMENNTSAHALKRILPRTINMRDYGGMEKIGMLWKGLPRNDMSISANPGDIILFMGNMFVIYYESNSWNFTKFGHINDVTHEELREIFGSGNATITLSLPAPADTP